MPVLVASSKSARSSSPQLSTISLASTISVICGRSTTIDCANGVVLPQISVANQFKVALVVSHGAPSVVIVAPTKVTAAVSQLSKALGASIPSACGVKSVIHRLKVSGVTASKMGAVSSERLS